MTVHHADPWLTIHGGDNRDVLPTLPDESVHCVVTSPPYWGLRDYGTASWEGGEAGCDHKSGQLRMSDKTTIGRANGGKGEPILTAASRVDVQTPYRDRCGKCGATRIDRQLGLEPTPEEYVANMVAVFREVRRVLRSDGTCWLNLGDSYAMSTKGKGGDWKHDAGPAAAGRTFTDRRSSIPPGLKPKDLVGIPWRVAFALQADGWYLRSDIIWAKPNPMPESVTDRPTKAHEYLFLLTKAGRYWYDADAVKEAVSPNSDFGKERPAEAMPSSFGNHRARLGNGSVGDASGRNRRSVWNVATQPYPGAHFAVMPEALVEPCVLAGCPDQACATCGAPWERVVEREVGTDGRKNLGDRERNRGGRTDGLTKLPDGYRVTTTTTGWRPTCAHADAPTVPGVTLDPFGGSGTVARVANRLSRRAVLIDLSPEYLKQQMERTMDIPLGLTAA